jgi:hypothetical protein
MKDSCEEPKRDLIFISPEGTKVWGYYSDTTDTYVVHREEWWQNGQRHRVDGPAIIRADGREEWWEYDVRIDI